MGDGVSALGQAAGAIGAAIFGSGISARASAREAKRNRAFQERMSNTAYQRGMADMEKAGLNPILSAKLGGASSPAGAMANIPDLGSSMTSAMSSNLGYETVDATRENILADTEVKQATENLTEAQIDVAIATAEKVLAETDGIQAEAKVKEILAEELTENPDLVTAKYMGVDAKNFRSLFVHGTMVIWNYLKDNSKQGGNTAPKTNTRQENRGQR